MQPIDAPSDRVQNRDRTHNNTDLNVTAQNEVDDIRKKQLTKTTSTLAADTQALVRDGTLPNISIESGALSDAKAKGDATPLVNSDGFRESTTAPKGDSETTTAIQNPDGSLSTRTVNKDGSIVVRQQQPNGSYVETVTNQNGTSRIVHEEIDVLRLDPDSGFAFQFLGPGSSITREYDPAGNVVRNRKTQPDGSYSERRTNTDGTTTVHDQEANGDYTEVTLNSEGDEVSPLVRVSGASPEFVRQVMRDIASLPEPVRELLAQKGIEIGIGGTLTDIAPDLSGRPRGWPPGSTWDDVDGVFANPLVGIAERTAAGRSDRREGVLKHETGHAVDHALGNFSTSDEFEAAYNRDVAALSPDARSGEQYLLQPGDAGKSEAFAEVFAAINGASANSEQTEHVLQTYPNLVALIRKKINELPG